MRSKGSRFTLGVWGLRVCSLDVAFVVATVRNRPQPSVRTPYGRAYGKFCRGGQFWRFPMCRCFVSRGRRGTSWHSDVFCNVFCVAGAILVWRFQKMCCSFRGRRSTLDVSIVIFRGRRSTLDVSRCVFFVNRIGKGCVKWRQGANFVAGVAFCAMCWKLDGSLARNIDFEVANFQVRRKTRRKTSILKLQNVKIGGSLARNARFGAPTCLVSSLWFSRGFAVSMGEAAKPVLLSCCQLWKLPEVSHEMLVFLHPRVLSRVAGFPVASPCLWGKLENISYSNVSKQVVMSFCVPGVALCDIPTCLIMCRKCQNWRKSRTKCWFFCIHASCLESLVFLWRRRVYGGSSALHTLHFTLHSTLSTPHSSLYTLHSTLSTPHSTLYTPHSTLYTPHSTLYTHHFTLYTPHFTLYTHHFTLLTPHSTLYTPHSTLYTPHSTLHTLHSTLHTPHFPLHTPHFTLYTLHTTLYTFHSTLSTLHSSLNTPHFTLLTPHFTLLTLHSTLHTPHFALYTPHSTLYTLHSTLHTPHSTLYTPHSTLYTPYSTLYTLHSAFFTLHTLHSPLHTLHSTLLTSHTTIHTLHFPLHTADW